MQNATMDEPKEIHYYMTKCLHVEPLLVVAKRIL